MFLQLSMLLFAVQWLGSPLQLIAFPPAGILKAILSCLLFTAIIIISVIPAMSREWKTYIKSLIVCALIQQVFLFFTFLLPGVGLLITIIYHIVLIIISKKLPVSFTNAVKTGILFFILWFAGINYLLGIFILTDPRGVLSGDLYFQPADWAILVIFIAALARTIYHITVNLKPQKNIDQDINEGTLNAEKEKREKKTLIPALALSALALAASAFIQFPWQQQAVNDLKAGFAAAEAGDYESAKITAQKYYNEKKILHNGDVFYLNGLVKENESPQEAVQYFIKAAAWYKNHNSLVSENYRADAQSRIASIYEEENTGFFKRVWNNLKNIF